jgi:hypothetical protein
VYFQTLTINREKIFPLHVLLWPIFSAKIKKKKKQGFKLRSYYCNSGGGGGRNLPVDTDIHNDRLHLKQSSVFRKVLNPLALIIYRLLKHSHSRRSTYNVCVWRNVWMVSVNKEIEPTEFPLNITWAVVFHCVNYFTSVSNTVKNNTIWAVQLATIPHTAII